MSVRRRDHQQSRRLARKAFYRQHGLCFWCQRPMLLGSSGGNGSCDPLAMTADHLRPVRDGGQTPGNIVAACYECNQARGQVTNRTRIRTEYDLASTAAVGKLIPLQLEFPSDAWMAWMKAAMHRWKRDGAA